MDSKKSLKKTFLKDSFWAGVGSILNRLGSFVFGIILARFLLPEKYGMYSLVISIAMIFFTFTETGIDVALIRYISYSLAKDKRRLASIIIIF